MTDEPEKPMSAPPRRDVGSITLWLTAGLLGLTIAGPLLASIMDKVDWQRFTDAIGYMVGRDCINIWTAGKIVLSGDLSPLFDTEVYANLQKTLFNNPILPFHAWSYPPFFLFATVPFGLLSYPAAYAVWVVVTLAMMIYAARVAGASRASMAMLVVAPANIFTIWCGQNGFITAALFIGALALLDRRPIVAGVLIGVLSYKPQLGILLPLALMVGGYWRTVFAAGVTVVGLIAISAAVFGADLWATWLYNLVTLHPAYSLHGKGFFMYLQPTFLISGRLLDLPLGFIMAFSLVAMILCVLASVWTFRLARGGNQEIRDLRNAILLMLVIPATPYAFVYDMPIISGALLFALPHIKTTLQPRLWVVLAVTWFTPATILYLHAIDLGIEPFIMVVAIVGLMATLRQRVAARSGPVPLPA